MSFILNPEYGTGIFRRRIYLQSETGQVLAELEDTNHAFRVYLKHDGQQVLAIETEAVRFPYNTCPSAAEEIKKLVGVALDADTITIRQLADPGRNCTHLHDLASLAMAHSQRQEQERVYDVQIPDELDGSATLSVLCNGHTVHNWQLEMPHKIAASSSFEEGPLFRGFFAWATRYFSGDNLEAALVLQRGYFVAQTRRYDFKNFTGRAAAEDSRRPDACYTYNTGIVEQAFQVENAIRDFTDTSEKLLKFE